MFKMYHKFYLIAKFQIQVVLMYYLQKNFLNIKKIKFYGRRFWWGLQPVLMSNYKFIEVSINHKDRIDGKTNVYKLNKILYDCYLIMQ